MRRMSLICLGISLAAAGCNGDGTTGGAEDTAAVAGPGDSSDAGDVSAEPDTLDAGDGPVDTGGAPDPEQPQCWRDLTLGKAVVFAEGITDGAEGISAGPDGNLYITAGKPRAVVRLRPDGSMEQVAELPTGNGLAATADGALLVAALGESIKAGETDGAVYRVELSGDVTLLADGIDSPNFVTMLADGSALVSDDFDTRVWRVQQDGTVTLAIEGLPSPNGMALSPDGRHLYVASTFTADGQITRIPMGPDGMPLPQGWETIGKLGPTAFPDGLAVDELDRVYVAANLASAIVRVRGDGEGDPEVLASSLTTPASLAFGPAPGFDPCSLYVTELFGTRVWRIAVGARGVPLPPR